MSPTEENPNCLNCAKFIGCTKSYEESLNCPNLPEIDSYSEETEIFIAITLGVCLLITLLLAKI